MIHDEDDLDRQLVMLAQDDSEPSDMLRARTLTASLAALEQPVQTGSRPALPSAARSIGRLAPDAPPDPADTTRRGARRNADQPSWRRAARSLVVMTRGQSLRYGAVAAVVCVLMLGGLAIWPGGTDSGSSTVLWWTGPPAAWAGELDAALGEAIASGVTCRQHMLIVHADGSSHEAHTSATFYSSSDAFRRDIYDGDVLRETQWYTPDGEDTIQTSVRFDTGSFTVLRHSGSYGQQNPMERLRFYVRLLPKADRQLGPETIAGHECVGFEVRASQYGNNPDTWIDRIWFDANTRLPVRLEQSGRPLTGDDSATVTTICDQFDSDAILPADTFARTIPSGFIEADADDLDG